MGEEGDTDSLGWQCKFLVVGGVVVGVEEGDTDSLGWQCKCLVVGGGGRGGGH